MNQKREKVTAYRNHPAQCAPHHTVKTRIFHAYTWKWMELSTILANTHSLSRKSRVEKGRSSSSISSSPTTGFLCGAVSAFNETFYILKMKNFPEKVWENFGNTAAKKNLIKINLQIFYFWHSVFKKFDKPIGNIFRATSERNFTFKKFTLPFTSIRSTQYDYSQVELEMLGLNGLKGVSDNCNGSNPRRSRTN